MESKMTKTIFLCGFMGAGKSSVGRYLADQLNYRFDDLDDIIEREEQMPITEIFDQHGEQYFRRKERGAVLHSLEKDEHVVALGGGALQDQALTDIIKNKSLLVFIDCSMSAILHRLKGDTQRPLLLNDDGTMKEEYRLKKDLNALYESRRPLYEQAQLTVDSCTFSSPREAANTLYTKIEQYV